MTSVLCVVAFHIFFLGSWLQSRGCRWAVDEWAENEMVHFSRLLKIVGHRPSSTPSPPPTYFPIPLSTTQQLTRHSLKFFPINS